MTSGCTSVDYQRAAALISHRLVGDLVGVEAVLGDAWEIGRIEELLLCVLHAFGELAAEAGADRNLMASLSSKTAVQLATGKHDRPA